MLFNEKHGAFVQNKQNFQHFKGFCLLTEKNNKTCEIAKSLITQTIVSIIRDSYVKSVEMTKSLVLNHLVTTNSLIPICG